MTTAATQEVEPLKLDAGTLVFRTCETCKLRKEELCEASSDPKVTDARLAAAYLLSTVLTGRFRGRIEDILQCGEAFIRRAEDLYEEESPGGDAFRRLVYRILNGEELPAVINVGGTTRTDATEVKDEINEENRPTNLRGKLLQAAAQRYGTDVKTLKTSNRLSHVSMARRVATLVGRYALNMRAAEVADMLDVTETAVNRFLKEEQKNPGSPFQEAAREISKGLGIAYPG